MRFLRRNDAGQAVAWWAAVSDYPGGAPGVVRELLHGPSVVCDPIEADQAMAWARAHPAWIDELAPPLVMVDSMAACVSTAAPD